MNFSATAFTALFTPPQPHQASVAEHGRDSFRRVLAASMGNGPSLDEVRKTIFWLKPPAGNDAQTGAARLDVSTWDGRAGRPHFVIDSRTGRGAVTALGEDAVEKLVRLSPAIQDALHVHWGERPVLEIRVRETTLDLFSGDVTLYRIPFFCMSDKCARLRKFYVGSHQPGDPSEKQITDRALLRRIERRILLDIAEQAKIFGWSLPADCAPRIFNLRAVQLSPVSVRRPKFYPRFVVTFQSTARLEGEWFLGSLISRGYGRLITDFVPHEPRRAFPAAHRLTAPQALSLA